MKGMPLKNFMRRLAIDGFYRTRLKYTRQPMCSLTGLKTELLICNPNSSGGEMQVACTKMLSGPASCAEMQKVLFIFLKKVVRCSYRTSSMSNIGPGKITF